MTNALQRFPRLERGHILAEIAKRVWIRSEFFARDTKLGTEFVFHVPIRRRFKKQDAGLYRALFFPPGTDWERTLNEAFEIPLPDARQLPL